MYLLCCICAINDSYNIYHKLFNDETLNYYVKRRVDTTVKGYKSEEESIEF